MTEDLLAMLGHDLRNPGTALVSCLEYLDEVVSDPEGREALEDAQVSLRQFRTAWVRIDALAGRCEPRWEEVRDVVPALRRTAESAGAKLKGTPHLLAPSGVELVVDALAETTRGGTIEVEERRIVVSDSVGPLPARWRSQAFDVQAQPELKRLGRYARFAGLVAARRVADQLGLKLVAGDVALFVLEMPSSREGAGGASRRASGR